MTDVTPNETKSAARQDAEQRIPLLKRSAGARILLAVSLILAAGMLFLLLFTRGIVTDAVNKYYSDTGSLVSELVTQVAGFYIDDVRSFGNSQEGRYLKKVCQENGIHSIWVETSDPPFDTGVNQVYLLADRDMTDEELETMWNSPFALEDAEKRIFRGEIRNEMLRYVNFSGDRLVTYMHGMFMEDGNCHAIVGVNFREAAISAEVRLAAGRATVGVAGLFLALMIVLGILLHRLIFVPVRNVSRHMRDFIDGDQLHAEPVPVKGKDELADLAGAYNTMAQEIGSYIREVGDYVKEVTALQKERLTAEAEMNVAAQIQAGMLPAPECRTTHGRIEAVMKPAKEVAGDFYDYLTLPDGRMFFTIADVSGKGVSAALFMAAAVNTVRYNAALSSTPAEILRAANADLCARNPEMLFVTAFAAVYDPKSGTLTYANAGHNPPYLIGERKIEKLQGADGLLLGLFPEEEYVNAEVSISPGQVLFLYTDGLPEAVNAEREMYGNERMEAALSAFSAGDHGTQLTERMQESMSAFAGGAEAHDDLTMMAVHFGREILLDADVKENGRLREFLFAESGLPEGERKKIALAAEEIFVNIASYAYDKTENGGVRVSTLYRDESFTIRLSDEGMPYNPLEQVQDADDYDPDLQIGGLGKLMTFTIMDRQEYEYRDGRNILTLTRTFETGGGQERFGNGT